MATTLTGKEIFFFWSTRCAFHLENLLSENKMQCKKKKKFDETKICQTYLRRIFFATSVSRWKNNALSLQKHI